MNSEPTEPTQRLFFALWPRAQGREQLQAVSRGLLGMRVRQVSAENYHLTLAFAGSVTAEVRHCLEQAADGISAEPFSLLIDRAGPWPRPRVVWAGPTPVPPELWSLVGSLRDAFTRCGLAPESRPYDAHITLARKAGKAPERTNFESFTWSIGDFCLVESVTAQAGVRYRILRRWKLGSG